MAQRATRGWVIQTTLGAPVTAAPFRHLITLRLAVSFLGEAGQAGWWSSNFLGRNSLAFLSPVFGGNAPLVQYSGVIEAAGRVHDERIGIGRVFHLFRLPESVEFAAFELFRQKELADEIAKCIASTESARAYLSAFAKEQPELISGPVRLPPLIITKQFAPSLCLMASYYEAGFEKSIQCFPYFSECN